MVEENELPARVNMSLPDKRSKIEKFEGTRKSDFDQCGHLEYDRLRRAFFEIIEAQKIDTDLLYNLYKSGITGLKHRDRFGPYNFGKEKIAPNPYGLTPVARPKARKKLA